MIRQAIASMVVLVMLATQLFAQPASRLAPTSVMVLPIDGTADPATRAKLTALVEVALAELGKVQSATTTLGETAAAIGCDPSTASCAETVRTTLAVDVLVYGTATAKPGGVELSITRLEKDKPAVTAVQQLPATGEPALDPVVMSPITGKPAPVVCPDHATAIDGQCPAAPAKPRPRTNRVIGISLLAGAGLLLVGGLSQWNEKSKKQDQIDAAPTRTLADFQALERLEDEAARKATTGNVLVLAALGFTVAGVYFVHRDRKAQRELKLTPSITPTSAGVVLTIGGP